jgi:hypothetical protein
MYSVLNCHNVAKHSEFTCDNYGSMCLPLVLQGVSNELYYSIPNVTVWRVLRKPLHLKAYKSFILQHFK